MCYGCSKLGGKVFRPTVKEVAMRLIYFFIALLACGFVSAAKDSSILGLKIAKKIEKANNGFRYEKARVRLVIESPSGGKVVREIDIKTQEKKGDGDRSLIEAVKPADAKGIKLLTWSHKVGSDDQWLYLPSLRRVKRLNKGTRTGSFMGSEFSFEDIGSKEIEKYKFKFLKN